jgi:hypothetical protein
MEMELNNVMSIKDSPLIYSKKMMRISTYIFIYLFSMHNVFKKWMDILFCFISILFDK